MNKNSVAFVLGLWHKGIAGTEGSRGSGLLVDCREGGPLVGAALVTFLRYEVWCLMGAFFVLIGYQILTGRIIMRGLLLAKDSRGCVSPARIQLLVFTLTSALYYLVSVMDDPNRLPEMPQQLLLILGGSNLFYVGSKARRLLSWLPHGEGQKQKEGGK